MVIFPEKLCQIDQKDVGKSLRAIENYIRYMDERITHAVDSVIKRSAADTDSIRADIRSIQERFDRLEETINGG